MIRKILTLFLTLCFASTLVVFADDDEWSDFSKVDNAWDGQKAITNKQFEETMNALQAKKKKKEAKAREKQIRKVKGQSLTPEMDAHNDNMKTESPMDLPEEGELINIPADIISDGKIIDRGFYKVTGVKENDNVYIILSQAHTIVAKIKAHETKDDFDQPAIQFVKLITVSDSQMRIIFGNVDFNAYVNLPCVQPEAVF